MRTLALAGLLAVTSSLAIAQTAAPEQPAPLVLPPAQGQAPVDRPTAPAAAPAEPQAAQTPAPAAEAAPAPAAQTAPAQQAGPANLCNELLAYMKAPPEPVAPAPGAAPAPAAAPGAAAAPAPAAAPATSGGSASAQATPPQPPGDTASAQQASGQSGPAVEGPKPNAAPAAQGGGQNAPATAGISAPVPATPPAVDKTTIMSVADAEALASAGDMAECRAGARKLRLAGVAVPAPLLALAALDLKFFNPAPAVATEQAPAEQQQ